MAFNLSAFLDMKMVSFGHFLCECVCVPASAFHCLVNVLGNSLFIVFVAVFFSITLVLRALHAHTNNVFRFGLVREKDIYVSWSTIAIK